MNKPLFNDDDTQDQVLYVILDNTLNALFPYLTKDNAQELADAVKQSLDTHLVTELEIVNGNDDDGCTVGLAVELAKEFKESRRVSSGKCRTCDSPYDGYGDGYDGECPICAGKTEAKRGTHPQQ